MKNPESNPSQIYPVQHWVQVSKQFHFEAAHSLPHLPEGHKCRNFHGHGYGVTIVCAGRMEGDWLIDYAEIDRLWNERVFHLVDHQNLNNVLPGVTTAERLAVWIAEQLLDHLPFLYEVHVQETHSTNVILRTGGRGLIAKVMRPI